VLVQGPPGTGKSHTIANLIGHLVAQGKRVLVTSYTTKALRVLREHLVEELRPLCVALLDNDLEGRTQMEQAVRGIVHRLSTSTEERLLADLRTLSDERQKLLLEIERVTEELRAVRQSEYLPIVLVNEDVAPAEAARFVEKEADRVGWLPGPVALGAPLPITEMELRELYETNDAVSSDEEGDLSTRIPALAELPSADEMEAAVDLIQSTRRAPSERFWSAVPDLSQTAPLQALGRSIDQLVREIGALAIWQRNVVAAGRSGGAEEQVWRQLGEQVKGAATRWQEARPLLIEHAPTIDVGLPIKEVLEELGQIRAHVSGGGSLGGVSMIFRTRWKTILEGCRVSGQAPREAAHFEALAHHAEITQTRAELGQRWGRQAVAAGLPAFETLPDPPEPTLADYVQQFERLLALWSLRWRQISQQLEALGFAWSEFRADEIATATPAAPFEADLAIVTGPLRNAIERRLEAVRRLDALRRLKRASEDLEAFKPAVCRALRRAPHRAGRPRLPARGGALEEMWQRVATLKRRRELLQKLGATAPGLGGDDRGAAGRARLALSPQGHRRGLEVAAAGRRAGPPGPAGRADPGGRMETQLRQLQEVTVQLVDRKAWLSQLRRTDLEARQALIGWADTQRKIGKGTGKRAPALQLKARELLTRAREAVPVWIMPLARGGRELRSPPGALRRGDHRRGQPVRSDRACWRCTWGRRRPSSATTSRSAPSSIGEAAEDTNALISQFLTGIPNNHLYDGQTSVYDLARQSFGGTIGLREHFRCVPDIIEFSNHLSYQGEIRPLRDPATAPRPHVVEYQVPAALAPERKGKVNEGEARAAAALAAAAMQLPEYEGKTFGVLSLLGDEQAARVQELIQLLVPLEQLERRRFVAGNPAQFQGDERDVAILSMVDVPVAGGLPLQERTTFKQRYNVAASRARDQLWLVHSLDPARDLQPSDLRRRLIEHVRSPEAQRRTAEGVRAGSPFEQDVLERLRREGFAAEAQVAVGGYRIDIVVSDGRRQVAIECDGDRLRPPEKIEEDMIAQSVLERVGWRFIHVRSTRYCRDPDGSIDWVVKELRRLGVEPERHAQKSADPSGENLRNKVIRRAWQIMREQEWITEEPAPPAAPEVDEETVTTPSATVAELVLDDTTEPHFVIIEQEPTVVDEQEEESTVTTRPPVVPTREVRCAAQQRAAQQQGAADQEGQQHEPHVAASWRQPGTPPMWRTPCRASLRGQAGRRARSISSAARPCSRRSMARAHCEGDGLGIAGGQGGRLAVHSSSMAVVATRWASSHCS
jgi:very-short-patch-repair endonuclease